MAHRNVYEAIDRSLRDVRQDERPFGGLTVVFSGDWRQILPVVRKGSRADVIDACFKSSPLWRHVTVKTLTRNMRIAQSAETDSDEDAAFALYLLKIGEGKISVDHSLGEYKIQIEDQFVLRDSTELGDLCDFVFPNIDDNISDASWISSRAILCPTNDSVDRVNTQLLKKLPGISRQYKSCDKLINAEDTLQYPAEFLNTLNPSGMPQHLITLKPNCPIMLLRNLDPIQGHCNGTRYIVNTLQSTRPRYRGYRGVRRACLSNDSSFREFLLHRMTTSVGPQSWTLSGERLFLSWTTIRSNEPCWESQQSQYFVSK